MQAKIGIIALATCFFSTHLYSQTSKGHDIIFCGERIPVDDQFIADKLMNVIRKQIKNVNMPQLRQSANKYFSIVESYLHSAGLPQDFKYLPIVESGFTMAVSKAKAVGFWQIMPETGKDWGLRMDEFVDERNNIFKSTQAACKELARNYLYIRKTYKISSWVLAAAAYNHGIGNISKAIKRQGNNYFQMNLNAETAIYVYKIIAVKELFEYPELYMKNFGYNVFNTVSNNPISYEDTSDIAGFSSMTLKVDEKDGNHPDQLDTTILFNKNNMRNYTFENQTSGTFTFVRAKITGKYKEFGDGDLVSFELLDNLQVGNSFTGKGTLVQWRGWKIDDRIYIDLGFDHNVILYDLSSKHGLSVAALNKKDLVIIRVNSSID